MDKAINNVIGGKCNTHRRDEKGIQMSENLRGQRLDRSRYRWEQARENPLPKNFPSSTQLHGINQLVMS